MKTKKASFFAVIANADGSGGSLALPGSWQF
jgi:hypothetical protein